MAKPPKAAAPPAAKPKFCTSKVRDIAEVKLCNFKLKSHPLGGDYCDNKANHLHTMLTGFCHSGWHEGMKARSASGQPAPTCKFYINCPCDCHARLNRMFDLAGNERILVDNSDWKPESTFVMPTARDVIVASSFIPAGTGVGIMRESPAPEIVPATIERTFVPTPTGRAGRGELESWVREATDIWAVEKDVLCTPQYVAKMIGQRKGINPPSSGAVDAVFNRWAALGFAKIERKPTRFEGYTEDGIKLGLETMKARAKRTAAR